MKAKGTYTVKKWEELSYQQMTPEKKMTKASVEYNLSGEIEGKASVEYLMFYSHSDPKDQHKSSASYVGLIYFDGTLSGKSGSFVLEDNGTFEGGVAKAALRIAKGSGTGQLEGIHGIGMYLANREGCHFELEYNFD
ncbi:MAG: DUF3224 domain-containing protein [Ignavibacteriae bacterium]|nr:DUF3224 domain-containing protein [Ignavibacteria bacterium]MBI3365625.1 DUF3224 domain-containing protein [Ignavibacteriota bacterium]